MRISFDWLQQYLDLSDSPEQVADILTSLGLEVEAIEKEEKIKGGLQGVVVGEVIECLAHPGADRLKLTKVNVGSGEPLQIVCGANNVAAGQKVFVAMEGCTLYPFRGDPLKIKKGKIRGEISEGMICAEDELGLGENHDGIMVLDNDLLPGTPASQVLHLSAEIIFEIGLTPNRADATNHIGVAKDLLAWYKVHQQSTQQISWPKGVSLTAQGQSLNIAVEVIDTKACPRYSGICIEGITIGESPEWLQQRIKSMGQKPVNNVVDVTNFVMYEMGQPLHAFDYDAIEGKKIIVQFLEGGHKFVTLDGQERSLSNKDLMICNGNGKPLCIAGVLGGIDSGVSEKTTRIFLESAYFDAATIRKTSMSHGIRTQAARCFEKGTDPNITLLAMERAAGLLIEMAGGSIASEVVDVYPKLIEAAEIRVSIGEISSLSGLELTEKEFNTIVSALDMKPTDVGEGMFLLKVPTNKPDVRRPADVVEEISRVYGLDRIPLPEKIQISFPHHISSSYFNRKKLSDELVARGLNEIMSLSLVKSSTCISSGLFEEKDLVMIHNTSNVNLDTMRPSLLFGGLEAILFNQNRQQANIQFFEFGKQFLKKENEIDEREYLGIFLSGEKFSKHWLRNKDENHDFMDLKAWIEFCFTLFSVSGYKTESMVKDGPWEWCLQWKVKGKCVAKGGLLQSSIGELFSIRKELWYGEIDWKALMNIVPTANKPFEDMSKFPGVKRDLALILPKDVHYDQVKKSVLSTAGNWLKDLQLFDIYENDEQVGKGNKSYALAFQFECMDHSPTTAEMDKIMERVSETLERDLRAKVRR